MSDQITYDNKVDLQVATNIANINKVTASDMNEIKSVVNTNAEEVGDTTSLTTTDKTNVVNAVNELNTPEKWVSVGATAPTDGRRVWFTKSNNLFNNNVERKNAYVVNPGSIGQVVAYNNSSATYSFVNCCKVKQGKTYTIRWEQNQTPASTNGRQGCIVDSNNIVKQYIVTWNYGGNYDTFTADANGFLILATDIYATNIQIYIERGIYVDNEQWFFDNYSTNEQVIGKWIDGKPLYRKVVDIGTLPNATTKQVAHNIANIGSVVTLRGIVTDYRFFPVPFSATSNAYTISIFADTTTIAVMTGNDRSNMTGFVIIEYTKTTD
jgi:hypothetical protein